MKNKKQSDLKIWARTYLQVILITFIFYGGLLFYTSIQDTTFNLNDPLHVSGDRYFTNFERPLIKDIFYLLQKINPFLDEDEEEALNQNLVKKDQVSFTNNIGILPTAIAKLTKCEDRTDLSAEEKENLC